MFRPVVVGHSLGGMIAVELAARHPMLVGAMISDDPGPINPPPETVRTFEGLAAQLAGPDGETVRRAWVEATVGPTAGPELRQMIVETMCAVPLGVAAAMIRGVTRWNGVPGAGAHARFRAARLQHARTPAASQRQAALWLHRRRRSLHHLEAPTR